MSMEDSRLRVGPGLRTGRFAMITSHARPEAGRYP
jgi:hypothetical protein